MIIIGDYKPICFTYYNPRTSIFKSGKSVRERVSVYKCSNCENCNAYKKKKCVMLNGIWGHSCPYGTIEKKEGFTKAARKCGYLVSEYKGKYGDVEYALKPLNFVCEIGDYVYLGLPHLNGYNNPIRNSDFFVDDDMIKKEDFIPEFIVELIKYRPCALMGGEISSYQKEYVPKFCDQLKRFMPDMYTRVCEIYPEIRSLVENIDYTGKIAKLMTLLPGKVELSTDILQWDGELLHGEGRQISFWNLKDEEVTIIPNENTMVKIRDNSTVTDETEFEE